MDHKLKCVMSYFSLTTPIFISAYCF